MTKTETTQRVMRLFEGTSDAYSFDRYRDRGWLACIRLLVRLGYDDRQIEAILRSKWMRWASDGADKPYGYANSASLAKFLEKGDRNPITPNDPRVEELTLGTFGPRADLTDGVAR